MGRIVMAAFKAKPGKQAELEELMQNHLSRLRAERLVTDRESIIMRAGDGTVIEVFEWASKEAIEAAHTNPAVLAMWKEYDAVCDYVPLSQVDEAKQLFSEFAPLN
jgi:quinol monooxygenase YgiN